jgi:hypothetical protein
MPITFTSSSDLVWGVPLTLHKVVKVPSGFEVARVRYRSNDFTTIFLKSGGRFEQWHIAFDDLGKKTIKPIYPVARNARPS